MEVIFIFHINYDYSIISAEETEAKNEAESGGMPHSESVSSAKVKFTSDCEDEPSRNIGWESEDVIESTYAALCHPHV